MRQSREFTEPTVLAFARGDETIRVPVGPFAEPAKFDEFAASVTPLGENRWRVDVELPFEPEQVAVDPDGVLLDANPGNNVWKSAREGALTPLYTMLDETTDERLRPVELHRGAVDLGAGGPGPVVHALDDGRPAGGRLPHRSSTTSARTPRSARTIATRWWARTRSCFATTASSARTGRRASAGRGAGWTGTAACTAASVYCAARSTSESSSMYLPPMMYHEGFATYQDNFLPFARTPGGDALGPARGWPATTYG